jgi:endoglycosylceramidase
VPPAAPAPQGWSVSRGFIRDPEGRAVVLRGANVSGRHKDPPYFDFHGAADYARMREQWGMNAVRFLVSWAALEPEKDQYDAKYLDAVAEHVKLATDAGLWVFLDMHQDLYGPGFVGGNGAPKWTCDAATYAAYQPTSPWFFNYLAQPVIACFDGFWKSRELQSHYVEAWRRLAARLKDNPGVIGFDPMNEPYWGSFDFAVFEEKRLAPLYLQVIAAVRSEQPNALAFVEPASSRNLGFASKLPPLGVANVVYTPHSYDADAEQGNGFDEAHRQKLTDNIAALAAEAKALDAALVLGEYGGIASAPGISDYMGAQYGATGARSAGAMYYDYAANDSYALLEADGGEKVVLLDAVARPFPSQVAGEPLGFSFDAASKTFRFSYRPVKGTTVISVPPRTWPGGYSIDCGGCPAKKTAHGVELETAGPGTDVSVVLTGN